MREYQIADWLNPFMQWARCHALDHSLDLKQKVACVIIKDGVFIGAGANGSTYHEQHGCRRKELGCRSGEGYELCEGCHPKNHAEPTAIGNAIARGNESKLRGADIYMWGHYWCCEPCWAAMEAVGIRDVYIVSKAARWFDANSPDYVFAEAA